MAKIQASDGTNVAVTIIDGWIEKVGQDQKLVIKLVGQDEKGDTGTATLWMTGERRDTNPKTDVELNLETLEHIGLQDGDMLNFAEFLDGKPAATFGVSVKDKNDDGNFKTNYYLRSPIEKIDLAEAAELIEQLRGKAAAESAEMAGTPVEDEKGDW